jgi:hypothetical protein
MKIHLCHSPFGLSPATDEDRDLLKLFFQEHGYDEVYEIDVKVSRNYRFHRKYMKLLRTAWEYQNEDTQKFFGCMDTWRKAVEVAAGNFELEYSIADNEWQQKSKSIAFDKMSEEEFQNLYERVKYVLFTDWLPDDVDDDFWEATKYF